MRLGWTGGRKLRGTENRTPLAAETLAPALAPGRLNMSGMLSYPDVFLIFACARYPKYGAEMGNVLADAYETYSENLRLVLVFSIPFIIAFAIPLLAPLPTFIAAGGTFLRTASIFVNPDLVGLAVIVASMIFSLLFLSLAFVGISLIVRARKTHVAVGKRALKDIEKYVGRVFAVLLAYALLLLAANILGYMAGVQGPATALAGFFGFAVIFYVPSAIVVDNKRIGRAVRDSVRLVLHAPQYYLLWLFLLAAVITLADAFFIFVAGTAWSGFIVLIATSVLILPYFVILQAESYMKRFALLTH
ncbi:MAG: hypothetical protein M1354_02865 [Candidatus Marsarchaeota archaeon]|nr:hypothetical protein [Candidatus Marsarchaeota archaeon]